MQTEKDDDDLVDYNELEDTSPPLIGLELTTRIREILTPQFPVQSA